MATFKNTEKFPVIIADGEPPLQLSRMSPTRSVTPSERTVSGTAPVTQVRSGCGAAETERQEKTGRSKTGRKNFIAKNTPLVRSLANAGRRCGIPASPAVTMESYSLG